MAPYNRSSGLMSSTVVSEALLRCAPFDGVGISGGSGVHPLNGRYAFRNGGHAIDLDTIIRALNL
ncbi:MAG: hypothetical protein JF606_21870 [Burkholderiales bacterium]|nr:hypothetical protein [Burkholderiales bacterium]